MSMPTSVFSTDTGQPRRTHVNNDRMATDNMLISDQFRAFNQKASTLPHDIARRILRHEQVHAVPRLAVYFLRFVRSVLGGRGWRL